MTGIAITFFVLAAVIVWGGLVASIIALSTRPEIRAYPDGGRDDATGG